MGGVGLVIAFMVPDIVGLVVVSAQIAVIFAPALIGGLIWSRPNKAAGFWSILVGFITTVALLPFNASLAFLPGFVLGLIIFITLSLKSKERFEVIR